MKIGSLMSGLFVVGALLLTGCGDSSNAKEQAAFSSVQKGEVLPYDNNAARVSVIRNEVEWANFWDVLYTNSSPKPARPSVDFREKVVVAVIDAPRPTGGYSITITEIQPNSSGISVVSSQVSPGPACVVTQAFTQPFHIVTVPVFSGMATLELSHSVTNCGQ